MSVRLYKHTKGIRKENIVRVRISDEKLEFIKNIAKKKNCSISAVIRKAIIFYIAECLDKI